MIEARFTDPDHDGRLPTGQPGINHPTDTDGGRIADYRDLDSYNDGLADIVEAGGVDSDGDALIDNFLDNDGNSHDDTLQSSAVFHIKWRNRKPVTTREQGAARREWWLHFQGLQRRARVVNDFPKGKTSVAICGVAPS